MAEYQHKVYYEDTDAGGIMYHGNYLNFAERARTDALADLGITQRSLRELDGSGFVVANAELTYKKPAVLEDVLTVTCTVKEIGSASVCMEQRLIRDSELLCEIEIVVVYIDKNGRPKRLPDAIRTKIETLIPKENV